ncbi:polysaccharide pyruvyl transferase family protein [Thiobacillus sp.]|uniref:polysaccharide pyruvyl transferase family protein n=1 Tax=Thiobacillus sp. TaxID=924 RepID=UPI0025E7EF5F|nr:polysaccharide pyruvyl transferase family protein [Thiobacillus sp.]
MSLGQSLIDPAIIVHHALRVSWPLRRLRAAAPRPGVPQALTRYAVIAGDASDPSGSLGDMAMFSALMQALRARTPAATFTIVGAHDHRIAVPGIGEVPVVAAWNGTAGAVAFDRLIRQHHALFVMGADILDGKYGAALVQRIVGYCNHSVQLGIPATTLGFSFNRQPRRPAVHALARLHPKVTVNVRDQPSLDRFARIVGIPASLCADSAFLMPPADDADPEAEAWIAAMRATGRIPVGVNLNAHALAPAIAQAGMDALIAHIAKLLGRAGEQFGLAYMLIPHDLKRQSADAVMLQALASQLQQRGFPHLRYTPVERPDEIKRLAGLLDLVITGRMHLAIAALGSATPTLSIAYQDKFEGLYQHVGLSPEHILSPLQCLGDELLTRIHHACAQRHDNRARIRARLPQVMALASRNLDLATC